MNRNNRTDKLHRSYSLVFWLWCICAIVPSIFFTPGRTFTQSLASSRYGVYDTDMPPASFFKSNREKVLSLMADSSSLLIYAAPARPRNGDMEYRYRQDDNFWYLTGCEEEDALLLLSKGGLIVNDSSKTPHTVHEILFVKPRNPANEQWTGRTLGPDGAKEVLGVDYALTNAKGDLLMVQKAFYQSAVVYLPLATEEETGDLARILRDLSGTIRWIQNECEIRTPAHFINRLREVKTHEEIALIRKAVDISVEGHLATFAACRDGIYEYQLQAAFESVVTSRGGEYVSYPSIVGSGDNSTILHYETNRKQARAGEVIVLDCGAEYHNYAADITRTIPVDGHFTKAQRAIYEIVLRAQDEAIAMLKPGVRYFPTVQNKAAGIIRDGLLRLGIIKDSSEYTRYFMHGLGHPVGLDVHDVQSGLPLREGEVWTVEPGIYISGDAKGVEEQYRGIGIRIEDDILITADGADVLSGKLPRNPDEIEQAMKELQRR